ncbi:MAG: DASS family sodium-coupled anion symporter [Actinomycetaceae bacterium]|nr:DASS family sodium-coupled anion symporter [Actinomycetaceae bacterium]
MSTPIVHDTGPVPEAAEYVPPDPKIWITRVVGLLSGIVLAVIIYYAMPDNAAEVAKRSIKPEDLEGMNLDGMPIVAAVAVLMGVWWMTEAIPLAATALVPMTLFPLLQVAPFSDAAGPYASHIIYLFMGGFILALAMQRWNLHRRIALNVVRIVGTKPRQLIGGFMIATGFLSMWVSNTATAVMMLPIGLSVLTLVEHLIGNQAFTPDDQEELAEEIEEIPEVARDATKGGAIGTIIAGAKDTIDTVKEHAVQHHSNFAVGLMLAIAYSASIGSLGTIIGTPPNALLVGYLKEKNITVNFGEWMLVGVPLAAVFMLVGWFVITYVLFKPEINEIPGGKKLIKDEIDKLGKMSAGEIWVAILFAAAAFSWVVVPFILKHYDVSIKGIDTIVALSVSMLLFIIPADPKRGVRLINWETAKDLPWDILLLFGGGLALSHQFSQTGLSNWIGEQVEGLQGLPVILILVIITMLVIFLTELTSNTATAAAFLPIIGGVGMGLGYGGHNVMLFVIPVALAATCAFMLPVATPPNAIAYGSGYVRMADMIKTGIWLNLIGVVLITLTVLALAVPVFELTLTAS